MNTEELVEVLVASSKRRGYLPVDRNYHQRRNNKGGKIKVLGNYGQTKLKDAFSVKRGTSEPKK